MTSWHEVESKSIAGNDEREYSDCSIFVLGDLRVERNQETIRGFRTQRVGLLIAYFVLHPLQSHQRSVIAEMLWPDTEPKLQLDRLRQHLFHVNAVGPILNVTKTRCALAKGVVSDVHEFERHYRASTLQTTPEQRLPLLRKSIGFYQGDFLGDMFLPEDIEAGKVERDWISYHRQRLSRAFDAACTQLIGDLRYMGLHEEAASVCSTQEHLQTKLDSPAQGSRKGRSIVTVSTPTHPTTISIYPTTISIHPTTEPSLTTFQSFSTFQMRQDGFYGREKELALLVKWAQRDEVVDPSEEDEASSEKENLSGSAQQSRILTLTGTGGIGKTRLAKEVARRARNDLPIFVDLSVLRDAELIPEAIHSALRLVQQAGVSPMVQVAAALRVRGPVILVLDNLEQLGQEAKEPVTELLERCPDTRLLITSRRALSIEHERTLPLHPLAHLAARDLFLRRALAIRQDFGDQSDPQLIDEVVTMLEGIPLALELAATRAALLEPEEMRPRVAQLLGFLSSIVPDRSKRHRSLRASLQWSFELLSPSAKTAMTRLSLFRGGISLAAVEAILSDLASPLDALQELFLNALVSADRSAVSSKVNRVVMRYSMLTVIQQFADEQLLFSEREKVELQFTSYFRELAGVVRDDMKLPQPTQAQELLSLERDNFRMAVAIASQRALKNVNIVPENSNTQLRSIDTAPSSVNQELRNSQATWPTLLHEFMERLGAPLIELGYWTDVDRMLNVVEQYVATTPLKQAQYLGLCGALARRRGNEELARRCWERKLELIRNGGEPDSIVNTLFDLCGQAIDEYDLPRARTLLAEGSEMAIQDCLLPRQVVAYVLHARIADQEGDLPKALHFADEAHGRIASGTFNESLVLYALLYTLPIYRQAAPGRFVQHVTDAIHRSATANQGFVIARFLDELGVFLLSLPLATQSEERTTSILLPSLYIASNIHRELASRLAIVSETSLEAYLKQHEANAFIPELLTRLRSQPRAESMESLLKSLSKESLLKLL